MKWLAAALVLIVIPPKPTPGGEGGQDPPKIEKGQPAPDFAAKNQKDEEVKLSELLKAKRNVLLAFYPKDFTGG